MERRKAKVIVSNAGGTAAKGSKTYKVSIPSAWVNEMGIDEARDIELVFDRNSIVINKPLTTEEYVSGKKAKGHSLIKLSFYDRDTLCSVIFADFIDKTFAFDNYINNAVKLPFGNNSTPVWEDFKSFLSERCIPKERSGIREYLETIGVAEYDELEIIKKTKGRMAEDSQWIETEEI